MSKKSPPKDPDYTPQRAEFSQAEYGRRLDKANDYNSQVSAYNDQIRGYGTQLSSLLGGSPDLKGLNSLSIRDDELFDTYANKLSGFENQLNSAKFTLQPPQFESVVQSPYGAVSVSTPQLQSIDNNYLSKLSGDIVSAKSQIDQLRQRRSAEEDRVRTFYNSLSSSLSDGLTQANQLSIADEAGIRALERSLGQYGSQKSGFSSTIFDEVYANGFSDLDNTYAEIGDRLAGLKSQRSAEQARIDAYRSNLNSAYDRFSSQLSGLDITRGDDLSALKSLIDAEQLGASRFSSQIGYDFTQPLYQIQDVENRIDSLLSQRDTELSRVRDAETQAYDTAAQIGLTASNANYADLASLNALGAAIDSARNKLSGFSSKLPFDFSPATTEIATAADRLAALRQQRGDALSAIDNSIDTLSPTISSIDLWNEQAMRDALSKVQGYSTDLSAFYGNDVSPIRTDILNAQRALESRLQELAARRSGINSDAERLLADVTGRSYYTTTDIDAAQAQVDALKSIIGQYDVSSANDEISSLLAALQSQRDRLAADAEARQSSVEGEGGYNLPMTGVPISAAEYAAFLSSLGRDDRSWWATPNSRRSYSTVIRL